MDRPELKVFFLLKRRLQVSVAIFGPAAKIAEHPLLPLLRDIVAGEPLLLLPRHDRVERAVSPRPARHNARLRALPADRLQRREERLGVGLAVPAAVALFLEQLAHLAA